MNVKQKKVVPDEDLDFVVFPRERLGKTYELNWTICKYAVIPNKVRTASIDDETFVLISRPLPALIRTARPSTISIREASRCCPTPLPVYVLSCFAAHATFRVSHVALWVYNTDKNKALHVTVPEEEYAFSHYFVLPSPPPAPAEGQAAPVDLMFVPENASVVNDGVAKNVSKEVLAPSATLVTRWV